MERRLEDFAETAVDLVVGELKNNVVQLGTEGDETIYQVRVARSQIPTLLNAGLSLFVYDNVGVPVSRFLTYEDEIGLLFQRYEAAAGKPCRRNSAPNMPAEITMTPGTRPTAASSNGWTPSARTGMRHIGPCLRKRTRVCSM